MNNDELFGQMVQRLGVELKVPAWPGEAGTSIAGDDRGFGAQAAAVMLEASDAYLVSAKPVHDRRTRTLVSLFGPVDVTRIARGQARWPHGLSPGTDPQEGQTPALAEEPGQELQGSP